MDEGKATPPASASAPAPDVSMPMLRQTPCPRLCLPVIEGMGKVKIHYALNATGTKAPSLTPGHQHVPVDQIMPRPGERTRILRAIHVLTVAESIATLGLLEPPILDTHGRVLAGAHRLAALRLLSSPDKAALRANFLAATGYTEPKKTDGITDIGVLLKRAEQIDPAPFHARYPGGMIPVYVVALDEAQAEFQALSIETAENSIRRQYTPDEVQGLFQRLLQAGFKHQNGRPKADDKTVVGALKGILGKSDSQVRRLLRGQRTQAKTEWQAATAALMRAAQRVHKASGSAKGEEAKQIMRAVSVILETAPEKHAGRRGRGS